MGSLSTASAMIVLGPKMMTWDDWACQKTVVVRKTRRKEVVPEGKMGFGILNKIWSQAYDMSATKNFTFSR